MLIFVGRVTRLYIGRGCGSCEPRLQVFAMIVSSWPFIFFVVVANQLPPCRGNIVYCCVLCLVSLSVEHIDVVGRCGGSSFRQRQVH